jgi:hypothetical protein
MRFRAGSRLIRTLLGGLAALVARTLAPNVAGAQSEDPEPGSLEWQQRDLENVDRMTTRNQGQATQSEYLARMTVDGPPIGIGNLADQLDRPAGR